MRHAPALLLLAVVTLAGCGGSKNSDAAKRQARALVVASNRFAAAAQAAIRPVVARTTTSFNTCPVAAQAAAALPNESQLEPFDRILVYRALIKPYGTYVRTVRSLRLTDAGLRPATGALSSMSSYLQSFRRAHGTECGLIRAWRTAGFSRPFDVAEFAGVPSTSPPATELRTTRAMLAKVAERLRRLGIPPAAAHQFLVNSDPFR